MNFNVFFNEASMCLDDENICESMLRESVIDFVKCIIKISTLNNTTKVIYFNTLSELMVGERTLASLLNISNAREYWDRLRFSYVNGSVLYGVNFDDSQYFEFDNTVCRGGLMALIHDTITLSLNVSPRFLVNEIKGKHYILESDETKNVTVNNVFCCDISDSFCDLIKTYGIPVNNSTTIYSNENFIIQMYINDHNPPHIHVYSAGNKSNILARVNIRNFDLMEGSEKVQPVRKELLTWVEEHQDELLLSWELCQQGNYPRAIIPN